MKEQAKGRELIFLSSRDTQYQNNINITVAAKTRRNGDMNSTVLRDSLTNLKFRINGILINVLAQILGGYQLVFWLCCEAIEPRAIVIEILFYDSIDIERNPRI